MKKGEDVKRNHEFGRKWIRASLLVVLAVGLRTGYGAEAVRADEAAVATESTVYAAASADETPITAGSSDGEGTEISAENGENKAVTEEEAEDTENQTETETEAEGTENRIVTDTESENETTGTIPEEAAGEARTAEESDEDTFEKAADSEEAVDAEETVNSEEAADAEENADPEENADDIEEAADDEIQEENYLSVMDGVDYAPVYNFFYYRARYADLSAAFGDDQEAMLRHFLTYGMREQRQASEDFDEKSYRYAYQDLRLAYGKDYAKYYDHYLNYGIREGRKATGVTNIQNPVTTQNGMDYADVYDYAYYRAHNTDVANYFGDDDIAVLNHFVQYGMKEQRQAIATFNEKSYRYAYQDLRLAYGKEYAKYYEHYIRYGKKEKRTGTTGVTTIQNPVTKQNGTDYALVYDYFYYTAHNTDVAKYFGDDDIAVLNHFVQYGMKEQRQAIASFNEKSYRLTYQDLRVAYEDDYAKYYTHYIRYGAKEGRRATGVTTLQNPLTKLNGIDYSAFYNYFTYRSEHPDIVKRYGENDVATLRYFVTTLSTHDKIVAEKANAYNQVILVTAATGSYNATVSMYTKDDGKWSSLLSTYGYVGKAGIGQASETSTRTPAGDYTLGQAFGTKANPGTDLDYIQVDSTYYWVDDVKSAYYNKFITTREVSKSNWSSAEHIIDFQKEYAYVIAIDYNTDCVPGAGSAIFLHCANNTATNGCVSVPESQMIKILRNLQDGCHIIIQTV